MRIGALDQVDLPGSCVPLECLLALNRLAYVDELLEPDEHVHAVLARKCGALAGAVLLDARWQPIGNADVERAARLAGEDVGPVTAHGVAHSEICGVCVTMDPRDKPEDDTG